MALFDFGKLIQDVTRTKNQTISGIEQGVFQGAVNEVNTDLRAVFGSLPGRPAGSNPYNKGGGFDINSFRHHFELHGEVSKSDKFDVLISVPAEVSQGTTMRDLSLQCEVSELPSRDIEMIEFKHYAFTKRIPRLNQYNHVTFTFLCTGDMIEKKLFDRWLDIMIPVNTGLVNYPQDESGNFKYLGDVYINQRDTQNRLRYTVRLFNALPIGTAAMQQNWADDSIHRLSVTFAFEKWLSGDTAQMNYPRDFGSAAGNSRRSASTQDGVNNFTNVGLGIPKDLRALEKTLLPKIPFFKF
jgi:hypothetical protein